MSVRFVYSSHASVKTTRIYLGLRKEELLETYDLLEM